jgi:hypothetical protein
MAPSAAALAQLAQGLTRVARPLSAAPVQSSAAIAQNATPRVFNSATRSVESGLTRVARPFPFTDASRAVANSRRAALVSEAAGVRQNQAILNQSRRALENQFRRQVVRDTARAAITPATRAASTVGGILTRVPLVGTVIQKAAPFVKGAGPFLALTALTAIPSIFEFFAPGVHNWLLGGWRGDGKTKATITYPPGTIGGRNVPYRVEMVLKATNTNCIPLGTVNRTEIWQGPIVYQPTYFANGFKFSLTCKPAGAPQVQVKLIHAGITDNVGVYYEGVQNNSFIYTITPLDGVDETKPNYAAPIINRAPITQNPVKTAPSPAGTGINTANTAKNTAIAAVAVTIAAGKYSTKPPPSRDALKTPQKKFGTQLAPSPTQTAPATNPCKGNACGGATLDATKQNGEELKKLFDYLEKLGLADAILKINRIDEGVGPTIKDERGRKIGLSGHALKMFERVSQVGNYLRFDRITNLLTLAATVHNAAMLSNQLEQTLASALSNALAAFNIRDMDGNPLDINRIVGKSVEDAIKGAIGAQNYTELTTNWKKANRIYQAGANLINNVQSLRYSITGALETIASMNGKVANALKKYGVLGDNAYPWMNPSPNFDNKFMRGLETTENLVSNIDSIASEVLSAQETVTEIGKQKTELAAAIKDGTEKPGVDNTQQKEKATAAKTASKSPDISADNFIKPEG